MDQGVIFTFKANYLWATLEGTAEAIQVSDNVTLRDIIVLLEVIQHSERNLQHFSGMEWSAKIVYEWRVAQLHSQEHYTTFASIIENVTKIAKEIGIVDVEIGDIISFLRFMKTFQWSI